MTRAYPNGAVASFLIQMSSIFERISSNFNDFRRLSLRIIIISGAETSMIFHEMNKFVRKTRGHFGADYLYLVGNFDLNRKVSSNLMEI